MPPPQNRPNAICAILVSGEGLEPSVIALPGGSQKKNSRGLIILAFEWTEAEVDLVLIETYLYYLWK